LVLQTIITGISIGGILALPVMGVALIYGVTGILNYAIAVIGTFAAFVTWTLMGHGLFLAVLGGLAVSFALGFGLQRFILDPLTRRRGYDLALFFIITFGVATIVSGVITVAFPRPTISFELLQGTALSVGGVPISIQTIVAVSLAVGFLLLIRIVERTTRTGRSLRATSENLRMANLVGVNVSLICAVVSGLGVVLGFVGAFFWGVLYNLTVNSGWDLTFYGYIIAIVGGIGNVWGGMLAALLMGEVIAFAGTILSGTWQSVVLYAVLFLVLVFAPRGILGSERSI
jgi:branched-chain amino acid transport system permease protein